MGDGKGGGMGNLDRAGWEKSRKRTKQAFFLGGGERVDRKVCALATGNAGIPKFGEFSINAIGL